VSIASLLMQPSPNGRRVGIRIVTFEACSSFTHVTARRIAQPPTATLVTRHRPFRLPGRAACQLPDQSTILWVASSSTGDSRLQGALPCVDGSELAREIFTSRCWSVPPCVRPVDAVHMTAGHNALRGSGPGQLPAFDDAMALVGCPDRRNRPALHYVLFALPTFTSRRMLARPHSRRERDGFPIALAPGHQGPRHSCDLIGERDRGDLGAPAR